MLTYGADYSLLQNYLPFKTKKQIRKRFELIERDRQRTIQWIIRKRESEKRKTYFDNLFLEECSMIKWPKKPNNTEVS